MTAREKQAVIGVDIGGVLIAHSDDRSDTSFFSKHYLKTPACDGAFEAIRQLVSAGCDVHLVSKCGETVEGKSRKWLLTNRFYEITGLTPEKVHFCRERADKAAICTDLGATHFVDDRLEVLSYLHDVPNKYLFNPNPKEVSKFKAALDSVQKVSTWEQLLPLILVAELVAER
jgi:hypothetical protein